MFRRSAKLVIAAAVASVLLVPVAAVGSHDFTDVPDSSIFHGDISWLANNEVTKGCNPPANDEFCPDANVTRGQMAAFIHRLADGKIVHALTAVTADLALTAVRATDADDSALLDGMSADDLKTRTFAARELDPGTGLFDPGPGATLLTLDFEVPVAGSILVTYSTSMALDVDPTPLAVGPTLGACDGVFSHAEYAFGAVSGTHDFDSVAGVLHLPVEAGAHTLSLCGVVTNADVYIINAQLGVVYEPGGVAPPAPEPPAPNGFGS